MGGGVLRLRSLSGLSEEHVTLPARILKWSLTWRSTLRSTLGLHGARIPVNPELQTPSHEVGPQTPRSLSGVYLLAGFCSLTLTLNLHPKP